MSQMEAKRMKPLPSCFMTRIEGVPDRSAVKAGMAHFANSGPPGKTCGSCKHCIDASSGGQKGATRCAMFRKLTGRRGETISKKYAACRYFEPKSKH
jgi:hypothetical protein